MVSEKHPSSSIIKFVLTLIGLLLSFLRGQLYSLCSAPQKVSGTKYLLYICRVQSCVWRLPKYWPPPPSPPHERVFPRTKGGGEGGGTHLPGGEGGGGSIFWKTPDMGLASYSIISLRLSGIPPQVGTAAVFCFALCRRIFFKGTVRHVTGNDQDYLRKIPRAVVQISALL